MARQDYLKRQIEALTRIYAKLFLDKELDLDRDTQPQAEQTGEPISLQDDLELMVMRGEIGQAEDVLFEVLEEAVEQKVSRRECEELVTWFYGELDRMSDEELQRGDFSREEIMQGQAQALYLCIQAAD